MGSILMMGLFGIIIASVVNLFLHSSGLMWAITFIGVAVFMGLIAYDTQKLKALYASGFQNPIFGALTLYLDFINLFLLLLRVFGRRRD